jgi:hypothetical protein
LALEDDATLDYARAKAALERALHRIRIAETGKM